MKAGLVLTVFGLGVSLSLGCSSRQQEDGPLGSSSARVTTGGVTCTTEPDGTVDCDGSTGVGFHDPTGLHQPPPNGVYGFCGLAHIAGNFTTLYGGTHAPNVQIVPGSDGYWHLTAHFNGSYDHLTNNGAPEWACATEGDFTNFTTFSWISQDAVSAPSPANPDDAYIPGSGYAVCPWSQMAGLAMPYSASSTNNDFYATPASNTDLGVYADSSIVSGNLQANSWCTSVGQAPRYGDAHPGSTGGWTYPLNGTSMSATIASTSAAFCYITEYADMGWELSSSNEDEIRLYQSGGSWVLSKNQSAIHVSATCLPFDQSP